MDTPSSSMRDLARRLLAASQTVSDPHVHEAVLVSDKLRTSLTRFAGADGFTSLLRRALVLASAEAPSLQRVKVGADGRLEGFEQMAADVGTSAAAAAAAAAAAITAHLLGLLVTFIGESLTLALVREAWPDTSLDDLVDPQRSLAGEPEGVSPRTFPISNSESEISKKSAKRSGG